MANHDRSAASTLMDTAASTGFERPDSSAGGGDGGDDGGVDGGAGGGDPTVDPPATPPPGHDEPQNTAEDLDPWTSIGSPSYAPPTMNLDRLSEVLQAHHALIETEEIIQRALAVIGGGIPPPVRDRYDGTGLLMSSIVMHLRRAGDATTRLRQALEDH